MLLGGRAILLDLLATLVFSALYALTKNLQLALGLGAALAISQIAWRLLRREKVDALQWISVVTILAGGSATLVTQDARFVMMKPTVIYALVGLTMLRRGWMNRYMPEPALVFVPDLIVTAGYVWAGLMFFSAALNILLALTCNVVAWGTLMSIWGIASKTLLFLGQFTVMKSVSKHRAHAKTRTV